MEHRYIDLYKFRDFSEHLTYNDIWNDFDKYKICNIKQEDSKEWDYEEYKHYLVDALWDDYRLERANYRSYIEDNMNARFMMELRKSAILPIDDERIMDFYTKHSTCKTIQDIKDLRIEYLKFLNDDFADFDWQLYMLLRHFWGPKGTNILIDYECCYADGDKRKMRGPDDYRVDWLAQHIPPERLQWMI